jgi:site-specific DNA-adenine methylase
MTIRKLFPYYGAKSKMLDNMWPIFEQMAGQADSFLDVFGGSAIVLAMVKLNYPHIRCYYNDMDANLCNVFQVVKTNPRDLANKLEMFNNARAPFNELFQIAKEMSEATGHIDPVEAAAATMIRFTYSYSGMGSSPCGVSQYKDEQEARTNRVNNVLDMIPMWHEIFRDIVITNLDFPDAVNKFYRAPGNKLVYADPPYISYDGKGDGAAYKHKFGFDDFVALGGVIQNRYCPWIVSHKLDKQFETVIGRADHIHSFGVKYTTDDRGTKNAVESLYLYF